MTAIFRTLCAVFPLIAWGLAWSLSWGVLPARADTVRVAAVADGRTLILTDGSTLRLAAVRVPSGAARAEIARAALAELARDKAIAIDGPARFDRHGGRVVLPRLEDGTMLAVALLSAGLVQVEIPEEAPPGGLDMLYAAETTAREARRGFWSDPGFAVLDAAAVPPERIGGFAIVEGRVVEAVEVRGRGYLNFGPDWQTDFTATASPDDLRAMKRAGIDWAAYAGRILRVRGWLEGYNGPMIEIRNAAAIEALGE